MPYAFVTSITPGPNNILALNSISSYGWKKGKHVVLGISAGFLCVMVLCALGSYELSNFLPKLTGIMKYIGAAYIIWLAIHIIRSKQEEDHQTHKGSFWMGFALQFLNLKIILYAITINTGYVIPTSPSLGTLMIAALFSTIIGMSGTMVWALIGGVLQQQIIRHYKWINIIMALILVWSAYKIVVA